MSHSLTRGLSEYFRKLSIIGNYATGTCRRPIKMSPLCQLEMTLPGGSAELAYEPSVLKRARSNNGSGFVGRCIGRRAGAALRRGSAPVRRPTLTIVTSLSGRDGDICIWRTQRCIADEDGRQCQAWFPSLLLDHIVRAGEQRLRYSETERLRGL